MSAVLGEALRAAAALDLPVRDPSPVAIPAEDLADVVSAARREGLVGLVDQAVSSGVIQVDDASAAVIGDAAVDVAAWCLSVERHALGVSALLGGAGIEHRVLKGLTIAHRFEAHPGQRSFADVDVLVHGDDLDVSVAALRATGHERVQPEWRHGFVARWGKSVTVQSPSGVEVDVHRTLAAGPYGACGDPRVLWERAAATVDLGGVALPCLDLPSAFVHACVHAVAGQTARRASWRDVALLALHPDLDLVEVVALEEGLGVAACVSDAVGRAWTELQLGPVPVADEIAGRPIPRRDRRWLDLYRRDASFRRMALEAVPAIHGWTDRARYVAALVPRSARSGS